MWRERETAFQRGINKNEAQINTSQFKVVKSIYVYLEICLIYKKKDYTLRDPFYSLLKTPMLLKYFHTFSKCFIVFLKNKV